MNPWSSRCASFVLILSALAGCAGSPRQAVEPVAAQADSGAGESLGIARQGLNADEAARLQRALELMRARQYALAAMLLESLTGSSQPLLPLLNLAIIYRRLGRLEQAEATLRQVLEQDPANAIAYNELGIVERRAGRFREAGEAYRRALQVRPEYALAHLNLGILCDLYLQDPACAMKHYLAYQRIAGGEDPPVGLWIKDLGRRYPEQMPGDAGRPQSVVGP